MVHILSKHLNYHWLYCIGLNGNGKNFSQNNIIEKWQPALVYFKPPFRQDHNNKQSEKGFSYFVNKLSSPGALVLDPFMGTGEVLKVAKGLNRKPIGIDKDAYSVEIAKCQGRPENVLKWAV